MSSTSAFNDTLLEFLNDLTETFPEEKQIPVLTTKTELLKKSNPRKLVENCMKRLAPLANQIVQKDETIFKENSELIPGLNMSSMWDSNLSDNSKNAIWEYLNTLLMLGTTIMSIPGNMLQQIEAMANTCVQQMEAEDMKPDDMILQAQQALLGGGGGSNMLNDMVKNMQKQ